MKRILLAGIGNMFLGDDAFGCEVIRHLAKFPIPEGATVADFGIRSYDLAYSMMDGYDHVILIDAVQRGQAPGTLFLIEPELPAPGDSSEQMSVGHCMDPVGVLRMVQMFGGTPARILLVGCEPASFLVDEGDIALSEPVKAAVPQAVEMIRSLMIQALSEDPNAE